MDTKIITLIPGLRGGGFSTALTVLDIQDASERWVSPILNSFLIPVHTDFLIYFVIDYL
jgi:hypothetical protein